MKKIRKYFVIGIIFLFVGASILPSISGNVSKIKDIKSIKTEDINNAIQTNERDLLKTSATDWWPMHRHDPGNTGSTTSTGPNTNQLYWKETVSDEIFSAAPVICNDRMYISTGYYYKTLESLKITENSMFKTPDFTKILNDLITHNDEYYGGVYCLNADTGAKLWDYPLYAPNDPFIDDNKVFVTDFDLYSYDSSLYCINAETGTLNWDEPVGGLALSPTIGADDKIFLGGLNYYSYGGFLQCFDFDGNSLWTFDLDANEVLWFSAPAYCDGKVYFISVDIYSYEYGYLYCLNADTGQYIWSQPISSFVSYFGSSSPVCKDGKVFAVDFDYYDVVSDLKCFNANSGSLLWEYPLGNSIVLGTPAVSQDSVFVLILDLYSYNSWLYRISTSGSLDWKVIISGMSYLFSSSSPVCSANKVFVCYPEYYSYSSKISCMEIANGNLLWSANLDFVTIASPSIANHRLYIADLMGNIYAFGVSKIESAPILDFIDLKAGLLGILDILNLKIGVLGFSVILKNFGEGTAHNVKWEMEISGGLMFYPTMKNGEFDSMEPDQEEVITLMPVLGVGKPTFKFTCTYQMELDSSKQMLDAGTMQDHVGVVLPGFVGFPEGSQPDLVWRDVDTETEVEYIDDHPDFGTCVKISSPFIPDSWKNVRIMDPAGNEVYWNFCKFSEDPLNPNNNAGIIDEDWETMGNILSGDIWQVEVPQN